MNASGAEEGLQADTVLTLTLHAAVDHCNVVFRQILLVRVGNEVVDRKRREFISAWVRPCIAMAVRLRPRVIDCNHCRKKNRST